MWALIARHLANRLKQIHSMPDPRDDAGADHPRAGLRMRAALHTPAAEALLQVLSVLDADEGNREENDRITAGALSYARQCLNVALKNAATWPKDLFQPGSNANH